MHLVNNRLLRTLLLLVGLFAGPLWAQSFYLKTVPLTHPANGDLLHLDKQLAVSGHSSETRWLSLIDLEEFTATAITVPDNAQLFGKLLRAGQETEELIFLTTQGIGVYQPATDTVNALVEVPSIYRAVDAKRLWQMDMVVDVSGASVSDLLIPDFSAYHLLIQTESGDFDHYRLPIENLVQLWGKEPRFMPRKPYLVDFNLDGKTDIVFVRDGQLRVFLQQSDGAFTETYQTVSLGITIASDVEAIVRSGEGRDFSGLVIQRVHDITDLDNDGLADLIIRREQYVSALEQHENYRIHYGRRSDQGLVFAPEPDAHINTRGIQFESVFVDLNGDQRKDFYTPSATFGVGTIIRALLSGTTSLDMQFYLMKDDRSFSDKPDLNHKATANVSIGRAAIDLPLLQVAYLHNSDQKDLLVGEGQEQLQIIRTQENRLFAGESRRFKTSLPRNGAQVKVMDINRDGKDDLVLPFDSQEPEDRRNQVRFLIMQ
jgi:hypothetical protein